MSYMMNINNSQPGRYNTNVNMANGTVPQAAPVANQPVAANNGPAAAAANNNLNNKSYEELVEYYKTLGGDEADLEGMDEDVIREQITELLKIVQGGGRRRRTRRRASIKTRRRSSKKSRSRRRSSRK
jgi:hypothetical protein